MTVEILQPGFLTTLQDAGRAGLAHLGIGRAGAFDGLAFRLANALVGNPLAACALEITLLGPTLRFRHAAWIAVTGAPIPLRSDGVAARNWAAVRVPAGATIEMGAPRTGCRSYLAVRGGFDVAPVLGSRSMDVNARLGPFGGRPLRAGDVLQPGSDPAPGGHPLSPASTAMAWQLDPRPWHRVDPAMPLRLLPGTHLDHLTVASRACLFTTPFHVRADSNRVGLRLAGPTLEWAQPVEMISEGCVPGTLQLPPAGQPIAFGPECPASGGYPRIGQIAAVDLPRLAQLRPGDALRFTACTLGSAARALERRERALGELATHIAARLAP